MLHVGMLRCLRFLEGMWFYIDLTCDKEIMIITYALCQALQLQSQNVVNVMFLIRATKTLIQKLWEDGLDNFFTNVTYCFR